MVMAVREVVDECTEFCINFLKLRSRPLRILREIHNDFLFLGDETFMHIRPFLAREFKKSFIRTLKDGRMSSVRWFLNTSKLVNVKKIILHCGSKDVNAGNVPVSAVALQMRSILYLVKTKHPDCEIIISGQFALYDYPRAEERIDELNAEYSRMALNNVKYVSHSRLRAKIKEEVVDQMGLVTTNSVKAFVRELHNALRF
ncbi:hypothetical protein ACOME3_005423 [Neoechinorhynchus agilis]